MNSLHRFLVDYDMAMLRALAESRRVALDTNRQQEAADLLAVALGDPRSIQAAVAHLSGEGRAALDRLLAAGGQMRESHFSREFGQIRPAGPGRLEREAPWSSPANAAEELLYLGLIFRGFRLAEDQGGPGQFVVLPDEVQAVLPPPQVPAPAFAVEPVAPPHSPPHLEGTGGRSEETVRTLDEDLLAYVVYVQGHDVRPYADGRLGRRDSQALIEQLGRPAGRRLELARHLAGRLGMVARQGEYLRLQPAALKAWLIAPPARGLAMLQQAWRDDPSWIDLCHVPGLVCDTATDWLARYDPVAVRRAVLALLARCPRDAWWQCAAFVAAAKHAEPDFQRPDGDYGSWYIRDAAGDATAYLSGFESWEQVEGGLLADLLSGPLCWLGIITHVEGEAGGLCRLTEPGARLLGLAPDRPEAAPSPPIAVRPDLGIDVPAPASRYIRFQLERFSDLDEAEPRRYRLSAGALGRALGRGLRVEQILAFLRQASGRPVPPNVAAQLRQWARRS